jgi:putative oxidoreductase
MSITQPSPHRDRALCVLRVVSALVFISAGTMKLFDWPSSGMPGAPVPLFSEMGLAGVLEVFGGLAVLVGAFTRPVAFVLSGEMAVAYFQAHAPASLFPTVNGGVAAVLYCFLFLYLAFAGGGAWSIDGLLARRSEARTRLALASK